MVYELIFILVRRVLITLELVHAALLRTRTVRDLHACACVSVRVRKVPAPLPAAPRCLWARCAPVSAPVLPAPVHRRLLEVVVVVLVPCWGGQALGGRLHPTLQFRRN